MKHTREKENFENYSVSMKSSHFNFQNNCGFPPFHGQYGQQASLFLCGLIEHKLCSTDCIVINRSLNLKAGFPPKFYIMPGK